MNYVKRIGLSVALFFCWTTLFSQNVERPYFQQHVDYLIQVTLDDTLHELHAFEQVSYTNNSKSPLDSIYFHLWPNAYKDNSTALAKQLLENGSTDFFYSSEDEKGYIDSLDFKIDKKRVNWYFDSIHKDICVLKLPNTLAPGHSVTITTPFKVKLPGDFSRMGHADQSYQITQWYPKPAVYDREGWRPQPYLDQGEFYSEYGSFNVSITLPKNYVVGATGDLIEEEEKKWLLEKVSETEKISRFSDESPFPESSKEYKTISYYQKNVHDFAWFADKRYHVLKGKVELPNSTDSVDTWIMFTNDYAHLWKDAIPYMNRSIYAYSDWNGNYPYQQATAVYGALSAGSGMEYPNVTVIGETQSAGELEIVLVHELGHNWFQGILGFNEAEQPAMDEGINSFNELRYVETYMGDYSLVNSYLSPMLAKWLNMNSFTHRDENEMTYLMKARRNIDQPLNLHSKEYTSANYGSIVYAKKALSVQMLRSHLGDTLFDKCMHQFFEDWKFKHPTLQDWRNTLEEVSGKKLGWFFNEYYQTTAKADLKIKKIKKQDGFATVSIKNKSSFGLPMSITTYAGNQKIETIKYDGLIDGISEIKVPLKNASRIVVDGEKNLVEINRKNNSIKTRGLLKKMEPIQFRLFTSNENPNRSQLFYSPLVGWNTADELMLGLALHNKSLIEIPLEWYLGPMYSFKNEQLNGIADFSFHIYPNGFQRITANFNVMKFSYDIPINGFMSYVRYYPKLIFQIKPGKERSIFRQEIHLGAIHLEESYRGNSTSFIDQSNTFGELKYRASLNGTRQSLVADVNLTLHEDFDLATYTFDYKLKYNKRENQFSARLFIGQFLYNQSTSPVYNLRMDGQTGYLDYQKNQVYADRAGESDVWKNQMTDNHGGFKSPTAVGQSNSWLAALNIKFEAPIVVPIGVYADFGVSESVDFMYNAGVSFRIWRDICEIYFPVLYSDNIKTAYESNGIDYGERIRFTLNLPAANPYKNLQNLDL